MAKIHTMEEPQITNTMDSNTPVRPIHAENQVVESDGKSDLGLASELKPLFRTMSIFGLYHTPKRWQESRTSSKAKLLYSFQKFYCVLIQIVLWLQAFRMIISLWVGDEPSLDPKWTTLEFIGGLYFLQCAINSTLWFYICCTDQLPNAVSYWEKFCHSSRLTNNMLNKSLDATWIQRRIRILLGGGIFIIINYTVTIAVCTFGPIESLKNDTLFLTAPFTTYGHAWKVPTMIVTSLFNSTAFYFPIAVFVIFCMIHSRQFKTLTDTFNSFLTEDGKMTQNLLLFRRQHQYLCKSVQQTDQVFSFYLASKTCTIFTLLCFGLFQLVIEKSLPSQLAVIILASWMTLFTVYYAIVAVFAALVHEKVRVDTLKYCFNILNMD